MISGTGPECPWTRARRASGASPSFTGPTTISSGTLQLGNGNNPTFASATIADSGALAFNNNAAQTYPAVISGTGAMFQNTAFLTTLTGTSSFNGPLTVSAGTLVIGRGGLLGSAGTTTVAGVTLSAGNYSANIVESNGRGLVFASNFCPDLQRQYQRQWRQRQRPSWCPEQTQSVS